MKKQLSINNEDMNKVYLDSIDFININTGLNNFILTDITVFNNEQELIKYAIKKTPFNVSVAFASFHKYKQNEKIEITARLVQNFGDGTRKIFSFH